MLYSQMGAMSRPLQPILSSFSPSRTEPQALNDVSYQLGPRSSTFNTAHASGSNAKGKGRGRRGFHPSPSLQRCLIRLLLRTKVPQCTIAKALKRAGGPKGLWLAGFYKRALGLDKGIGLDSVRPKIEEPYIALQRASMEKRKDKRRAFSWPCVPESVVREQGAILESIQAGAGPSNMTLSDSLREPDHAMPAVKDSSLQMNVKQHLAASSKEDSRDVSPRVSSNHSPIAPAPELGRRGQKRQLSGEIADNAEDRASKRSYKKVQERIANMSKEDLVFHILQEDTNCDPQQVRFIAVDCSASGSANTSAASSRANTWDTAVRVQDDASRDFDKTIQSTANKRDAAGSGPSSLPATLQELHRGKADDRKALDSIMDQMKSMTKDENIAFVMGADENGVTGLHLALYYGWGSVIYLLCRLGANVRAKTIDGKSIRRFAKRAEIMVKDTINQWAPLFLSRTRFTLGHKPVLSEDTIREIEEYLSITRLTSTGISGQDVDPSRFGGVDEVIANQIAPQPNPPYMPTDDDMKPFIDMPDVVLNFNSHNFLETPFPLTATADYPNNTIAAQVSSSQSISLSNHSASQHHTPLTDNTPHDISAAGYTLSVFPPSSPSHTLNSYNVLTQSNAASGYYTRSPYHDATIPNNSFENSTSSLPNASTFTFDPNAILLTTLIPNPDPYNMSSGGNAYFPHVSDYDELLPSTTTTNAEMENAQYGYNFG